MKLNKTVKNIFCLSAIPLCILPIVSCSCSKKPTPVPPGPEPELKAEIILEKSSYSYTRDYSQQMKHLDISVPFTIKHDGIPDGIFKWYWDDFTTTDISAQVRDIIITTATISDISFHLNKDYTTVDKYYFELEDTNRNIELWYTQHSVTFLSPWYCSIHGKYVSSSGKIYECYTEFTIDIK